MVVGIAVDSYEIYSSRYNPRVITGVAGGWIGATLGSEGGVKIGGAIGTAIEPGGGTIVGGAIGGIIGGAVGYFGGKKASQTVYDKVVNRGFEFGK
ncbi:hypothetical protein [Chryseobacterium hispalense]|uniref:hypothetical protein n=1 Tax=Chryseobacterium hispalense TaxID=1453492 RepID=UPI003918C51F